MSEQAQTVFEAAMKLSAADRAALMDQLAQAVDGEPPTLTEAAATDALWAPELKRRMQEIDAGDAACLPWEAVRAELQQILDEKR